MMATCPLNIWSSDAFHDEVDEAESAEFLPEEYRPLMARAMMLAILEAAEPAGNC